MKKPFILLAVAALFVFKVGIFDAESTPISFCTQMSNGTIMPLKDSNNFLFCGVNDNNNVVALIYNEHTILQHSSDATSNFGDCDGDVRLKTVAIATAPAPDNTITIISLADDKIKFFDSTLNFCQAYPTGADPGSIQKLICMNNANNQPSILASTHHSLILYNPENNYTYTYLITYPVKPSDPDETISDFCQLKNGNILVATQRDDEGCRLYEYIYTADPASLTISKINKLVSDASNPKIFEISDNCYILVSDDERLTRFDRSTFETNVITNVQNAKGLKNKYIAQYDDGNLTLFDDKQSVLGSYKLNSHSRLEDCLELELNSGRIALITGNYAYDKSNQIIILTVI